MPDGTPPIAWQLQRGRFNRFLAILPPHDFSRLAGHLRTVTLERGVILHEAAGEIERVYFPHSGMVSLVAVMQSGATVETATVGRAGVIGASSGLGIVAAPRTVIMRLANPIRIPTASAFHSGLHVRQAERRRKGLARSAY
jgi:hypothetical protein